MPLIDHFDLLAPFYDRVIRSPEPEKLSRLADLPMQGILLDAGGGTGRVAQALRDKVADAIVVDLSLGMLRQANEKRCLWTICSQTELLPFPDQAFDRVIMVDALHHVCDQEHTIRELWRVLKPGGRVVIEEPDIGLVSVRLVALVEKFALMRSRVLSPVWIEALFSFDDASTHIEREGVTAWIVAEKDS
jgi:ubiquinone/menaquinone biosynthesis C-methylase UbiE